MKLKFSWYIVEIWNDGVLRPSCSIIDSPEDYKCCISSLLTDDEGLGLKHLIQWVNDGVFNLEKIKTGELDFFDWWGQAWGAEISKENVLIYYGGYGSDDIDYSDTIDFENFAKVLVAWRDFLQSEPSLDSAVEIEINL